MKSHSNTKQPTKNISIAVALIIAILLGYGVMSYAYSLWPFSSTQDNTSQDSDIDSPGSNSETNESEASDKQDFLDNQLEEQAQPKPVESSSVTITANQQDSLVVVQTQLKDIASGTCKLSVKNGSKTVSDQAEVMFSPEYSTCAGFSVPTSNLGAGTWEINLSVESAGVVVNKNISLSVR